MREVIFMLLTLGGPNKLLTDVENFKRVWISNYDGISSISYVNGKWKDNGYIPNFNKDVSEIKFLNKDFFFSGNGGVFELLNRQYQNAKVVDITRGLSTKKYDRDGSNRRSTYSRNGKWFI